MVLSEISVFVLPESVLDRAKSGTTAGNGDSDGGSEDLLRQPGDAARCGVRKFCFRFSFGGFSIVILGELGLAACNI